MSTYLWDPFAVLGRLDREFEAIVRDSFGARPRRAVAPATGAAVARKAPAFGAVVPSADVAADGEDVVISIELPGVDVEKDVTVEINRGRLVVHGERSASSESTEGGRIRRERWHGSFHREFTLPENVAADRVAASYDRGVLSVRLPGAATVPTSTRVPVTAAAPPAIPVAAEAAADEVAAPAAQPASDVVEQA
jgi:HSP20 family protein